MQLTVEQVIHKCKKALVDRKPYLMGRYGHCESRIMGFPEFYDRDEVNKSLLLQLGNDALPDSDVLMIKHYTIQAMNSADILGLALEVQVKNELDALWETLPNIIKSAGRSLEESLTCTPNFHLRALEENLFSELISYAEEILLITGRDIVDAFCLKFNKSARQVSAILVPSEARTAHRSDSPVEGPHYPMRFYENIKRINSRTYKGCLCLYGAGFLGKTYGMIVKQNGGVALDIGSVFDAWAGVMGRSFMNKHYLKKYAINGYEF